MVIAQALALINRMQADGIIDAYAIGGAVGATFYLEPIATLDLDVFVAFKALPGSTLLTLGPLYDYLAARGGIVRGEHIELAGWPVQFLPPSGPLVEEALVEAEETEVEGITTRVFSAEHLVAIALQTGRAKDRARILLFLEAGVLDRGRLAAILARFGLTARWADFEERFKEELP